MSVENINHEPVIPGLEKSDIPMPEGFNKLLSKVGETIQDQESITEEGFVELDTFLCIGENPMDSHIDTALGDFFSQYLA